MGTAAAPGPVAVYVGTYAGAGREALFLLRCDLGTGRLEVVRAWPAERPSFLALRPDGQRLYAVSEVGGDREGAVLAFAVGSDANLRPINAQRAHGRAPCHIAVDGTGACALVANYGSGSVVSYPLRRDGGLEEAAAVMQHEGRGVHPRQEGPHAHAVVVTPDNRFVCCPDLGCDQVRVYRLDAARGLLVRHDPPWVSLAPGAGPRQLRFHPLLPRAYVVNEIDSSVVACAWDAAAGCLRTLQVLPTVPPGWGERNAAAEVQLHPTGRFLYVSNRGHDSLAIYRVEGDTGLLHPLGHQPAGGRTPRHFALDPTGNWLLVAHQDSDTVVSFAVDAETGGLRPTGESAAVPTPVCLVFAPATPPSA
jgi:6-phosphogluconolactonase